MPRTLYQRALEIREQASGLDDPEVAASLNNLGALYADEGKYAQAQPIYERALAIREKALDADDPEPEQSGCALRFRRTRGRRAAAL
ncbi:MAG: hypothetical protein DMG32_17725 [Acidobacteria bacterium]|nr:MAG: hypothetical protein DMG32_17725 [Acidobacteriota bacterium]